MMAKNQQASEDEYSHHHHLAFSAWVDLQQGQLKEGETGPESSNGVVKQQGYRAAHLDTELHIWIQTVLKHQDLSTP